MREFQELLLKELNNLRDEKLEVSKENHIEARISDAMVHVLDEVISTINKIIKRSNSISLKDSSGPEFNV